MAKATTTIRTPDKMAITTSLKAIDTGILAVRKHYETSQSKVQAIALLIMEHAQKYGDCTRAAKLCRVVPARERNSLIGWFSLYSPIGVIMGKTMADDKARFIKNTSKFYHDFDLAAARVHNWYDDPAGVNPVPKALYKAADFFKMVESLAERMLKQAKEGNSKGEEVFDKDDKAIVEEGASNILDFTRKLRAKQLGAKAATEAKQDAANQDESDTRARRKKAAVGPVPITNAV